MAKFKVGDKVRVRENLKEDKTYGTKTFVSGMSCVKGRIVTISDVFPGRGYRIKECGYTWTDEMLENNFINSIDDLRFGDILTLRNGEKYVYASGCMYGEDEDYCRDCDTVSIWYRDDLTQNGGNQKEDIIKIERNTEVMFERTEEVKEMTVEEISKELGYEVKIVKESK